MMPVEEQAHQIPAPGADLVHQAGVVGRLQSGILKHEYRTSSETLHGFLPRKGRESHGHRCHNPPMSTPNLAAPFAHLPSTLKVGDREVRRLGFGAMRLPGKDVWGLPDDIENAKAVVRHAVELGVQFIDTSWYYGPHVSNPIIAEAIHPFAEDLLIATKLGGKRTVDKGWAPFNRPEELRLGHEHDRPGGAIVRNASAPGSGGLWTSSDVAVASAGGSSAAAAARCTRSDRPASPLRILSTYL